MRDPIVVDWEKDPEYQALAPSDKATALSNLFRKQAGNGLSGLDSVTRNTVEQDYVRQNMPEQRLPSPNVSFSPEDTAVDRANQLGSYFEQNAIPDYHKLPEDQRRAIRNRFIEDNFDLVDTGSYARQQLGKAPEKKDASGFLGALVSGTQRAVSGVRTAANVVTGDDEDVQRLSEEAKDIAATPQQQAFQEAVQSRVEEGGDDSIWQGIKNIAGAAWEQPRGALHEVAGQLPNSAVVMGSMFAGAKIGAKVGLIAGPKGSAIGAITGGIFGLIAGNIGIETGFLAQEQAQKGEYDRGDVLTKGAIKGGVISGVDIATMGLNVVMFKAAKNAVSRVLTKAGVDPLDDAAVMAAMKAKPDLAVAVKKAGGEAALKYAPEGVRGAMVKTAGAGLETVGEGAGEYFGAAAAGMDASFTEAVMEAMMSVPQSVGEVAVAKAVAAGKHIAGTKPEAETEDKVLGAAGVKDDPKWKKASDIVDSGKFTAPGTPEPEAGVTEGTEPGEPAAAGVTPPVAEGLSPEQIAAERNLIVDRIKELKTRLNNQVELLEKEDPASERYQKVLQSSQANQDEIDTLFLELSNIDGTAKPPSAETPKGEGGARWEEEQDFQSGEAAGRIMGEEEIEDIEGDPFGLRGGQRTAPTRTTPIGQKVPTPEATTGTAEGKTRDLGKIKESAVVAFTDMMESEGGLLPLSRFTPEEQQSLWDSGIVEQATTSTGNTYDGVNAEYLWQRRKELQGKGKDTKETPTPTEGVAPEADGKSPWEMSIEEYRQTQKPPGETFKTYGEKISEYRRYGDYKIQGSATGNMLADKLEAQSNALWNADKIGRDATPNVADATKGVASAETAQGQAEGEVTPTGKETLQVEPTIAESATVQETDAFTRDKWETGDLAYRSELAARGKWITASGNLSPVGKKIATSRWEDLSPAARSVINRLVAEDHPPTKAEVKEPTPEVKEPTPGGAVASKADLVAQKIGEHTAGFGQEWDAMDKKKRLTLLRKAGYAAADGKVTLRGHEYAERSWDKIPTDSKLRISGKEATAEIVKLNQEASGSAQRIDEQYQNWPGRKPPAEAPEKAEFDSLYVDFEGNVKAGKTSGEKVVIENDEGLTFVVHEDQQNKNKWAVSNIETGVTASMHELSKEDAISAAESSLMNRESIKDYLESKRKHFEEVMAEQAAEKKPEKTEDVITEFVRLLSTRGSARIGNRDYSIQKTDNVGYFYQYTEEGIRHTKGGGYPAKWSMSDAIDEAVQDAKWLIERQAPPTGAAPQKDALRKEVSQADPYDYKLPPGMSRIAPRYGYQEKAFELNFAEDFDRATYTLAQDTKNKSHDAILQSLMDATGLAEEALVGHGKIVKLDVRLVAKNRQHSGTIDISKVGFGTEAPAKKRPGSTLNYTPKQGWRDDLMLAREFAVNLFDDKPKGMVKNWSLEKAVSEIEKHYNGKEQEFRNAIQGRLGKGDKTVRIHELREDMPWNEIEFDNFIRYAFSDATVVLTTPGLENFTREELKDSFIDDSGKAYTNIAWASDIPKVETKAPEAVPDLTVSGQRKNLPGNEDLWYTVHKSLDGKFTVKIGHHTNTSVVPIYGDGDTAEAAYKRAVAMLREDIREKVGTAKPEPKYKVGDIVRIGNKEYKVERDSGYDDYLGDRRYKVRPIEGGSLITYNEKSMEIVPAAQPAGIPDKLKPPIFKIGDHVTPAPGSGLGPKNAGKIQHIQHDADGTLLISTEGTGNMHFRADNWVLSEPQKSPEYGAGNKVFTKERYEKARELLKKKLNQVGAGIDPEIMLAGIEIAGYHVEGGARKFADFTKAMIADFGEAVRPYLKTFYNAVRDFPDFNSEGMDSYASVDQQIEEEKAHGKERGNVPGSGDTKGREPAEAVGQERPEAQPGSDTGADQDVSTSQPSGGKELQGPGLSPETVGMAGQRPGGEDQRGDTGDRTDVVVPTTIVSDIGGNRSSLGGANYILRGKPPIALTKGERNRINSQVKELLDRGGPFTEAEKDILRQYTGEGGLSSGTKEALNQHYTDYPTIQAIYKAIEMAGFKFKRILEPAGGSGNFVGLYPHADWTTIDIDETNHKVMKALYPDAKHYHQSFENFTGTGYDLVISNVPFLEMRGIEGKAVRSDIKNLHDFYFVHALDRVKDNGIVAFITSRGTMDKLDSKVREEIVSKADIIGAYRLPGGHFEKNSHTSVVTDIIFMQKRPEGARAFAEQKKANESFVNASETADGIVLNEYYQGRMENLLGEVSIGKDKARFGKPTYAISQPADLGRINIKYEPYIMGTLKLKQPKPPETTKPWKKPEIDLDNIPRNSVEFEEWANINDVFIKSLVGTGFEKENVIVDVDTGRVRIVAKVVPFNDVRGEGRVYRDLEGPLAQKIVLLQSIANDIAAYQKTGSDVNQQQAMESIEEYKKLFETHPLKDKELKKLLKGVNEESYFAELSTLFGEDFSVPESLMAKTRYTGSGKAEITKDSPLKVRAFANEDAQGIINIKKAKFISIEEGIKLLEAGYSLMDYQGDGLMIQNDILYYSGNIYKKIDDAKRMIDDAKGYGAENLIPKLEEQIAALEEVKPETKTIDDIIFKGNEPWAMPILEDVGVSIEREIDKHGNEHFVYYKSQLYERWLNNLQLASIDEDEGPFYYYQRIKRLESGVLSINQDIKDKVKQSPEAVKRFEEEYNRRYRNYVKPQYDKAQYLIQDVLDEVAQNSSIKLRQNQIEWVIQAVYEGIGINAHDVGGGKTFAAIVLARVLKRRGVAQKPLFVVPAKTIHKWERDIKTLFPDANIVNLGKLSKEKRTQALGALTNQNADYILVSMEGFGKIDIPRADEARYVRQLINENLDDPEAGGREAGKLEEKIAALEAAVLASERDERITLDKLGIDMIMADEAHSYKNIGIRPKLQRFGLGSAMEVKVSSGKYAIRKVGEKYGIFHPFTGEAMNNGEEYLTLETAQSAAIYLPAIPDKVTLGSARAYDFRFKASYIAEKNNYKNIFLLTATPTPNKPMEIYTMLRHLSPRVFDDYGIRTDIDFSRAFFDLGISLDEASNKTKQVLRAIKNAQELRGVLNRFVDKRTMQELNIEGVPEQRPRKHVLQPPTEYFTIAEDLKVRQKNLKKRDNWNPGDDLLISIYGSGRQAAIDPRLYREGWAFHEQNYEGEPPDNIDYRTFEPTNDKIEFVISSVADNLKANPTGHQLIFLDKPGHRLAKAGAIPENIHSEIKKAIMERTGLKSSEVAIISGQEITNPATGNEVKSGDKDLRKQEIADAYNSGKVKVVIGTTESMGEGMDLQVYTTDVWNIDIPYVPGAFRQRLGRGVRFGNLNKEVNVHYLLMAGTFDNMSLDLVLRKKGWNEALWDKDVADVISTEEEMTSGATPQREQIMIELETDPQRKALLMIQLKGRQLSNELHDAYAADLNKRSYVDTLVALREAPLKETISKRRQDLADLYAKRKDMKEEAFEKSKAHREKLLSSAEKQLAEVGQKLVKARQDVVESKAKHGVAIRRYDEFNDKFHTRVPRVNADGETVMVQGLFVPPDFDINAPVYLPGDTPPQIREEDIRFKRSQPTKKEPLVRAAYLERSVNRLLRRFSGLKKDVVVVSQSESQLPVPLQAQLKKQGMSGRYDAMIWNGKIYLVADNLSGGDKTELALVEGLLRHEGRHYAIEKIFGTSEARDRFFGQVAEKYGSQVSEYIRKNKLENTPDNRIRAAEEVIIDLIRAGETGGLIDRFIAKIAELLRQIFPNLKISNAEVRELIARADRIIEGEENVVPIGQWSENARFMAEDVKAYDDALYAHDYVGLRAGRKLTEEEKRVRNMAYGIKSATSQELRSAAEEMAARIPGDKSKAILVPIPGHTGETAVNYELARHIAAITGGKVRDVLKRIPGESQRERRVHGRRPQKPEELRTVSAGEVKDKGNVYFIDNVISSGATIRAARDAVGGGRGLVFARGTAKGHRYLMGGQRLASEEGMSSLEVAKNMKASPEEIWEKTGWWKLGDEWKFEISPENAHFDTDKLADLLLGAVDSIREGKKKLVPGKSLSEQAKGLGVAMEATLGDVFNYPGLYELFPMAEDVKFVITTDGDYNASFDRPSNTLKLSIGNETPAEIMTWITRDEIPAGKFKSLIEHEIQHLVQSLENFPRGGSPEAMAGVDKFLPTQWASKLQSAIQKAESRPDKYFREKTPDGRTLSTVEDAKEELRVIKVLNAFDGYRLLTGEVEARMTQARLEMSPQQRKSEPPWVTMERMLWKEGLLKEDQKLNDVMVDHYYERELVNKYIAFTGTANLWASEPGFPNGRPRLAMIGTGHGVTAYGWGWYAAQSKKIAEYYRTAGLTPEQKETNKGNVYKLDIPDKSKPKMLKWDSPWSEQTPFVRDALTAAGVFEIVKRYDEDTLEGFKVIRSKHFDPTGRTIYNALSSIQKGEDAPVKDKAAAEYLLSLGIIGNTYLDFSDKSGQVSYDYVLWDQDTIDKIVVLERNENLLPVPPVELPEMQRRAKNMWATAVSRRASTPFWKRPFVQGLPEVKKSVWQTTGWWQTEDGRWLFTQPPTDTLRLDPEILPWNRPAEKTDGGETPFGDKSIRFSVKKDYKPEKTVTAYKLFRTLKKSPGQLFPLFIGKKNPTPIGEWLEAEFIPTKGYAERPGWHAGVLPIAPHLRSGGRISNDRVWAEIEVPADKEWQSKADTSKTRDIRNMVPDQGHYKFKTNKMQGGAWIIGGAIKIKRILTDDEVAGILKDAGYSQADINAEMHKDAGVLGQFQEKGTEADIRFSRKPGPVGEGGTVNPLDSISAMVLEHTEAHTLPGNVALRLIESVTDRLRRSKSRLMTHLANRIDGYYDQVDKRMGWWNGKLKPHLDAIGRKDRKKFYKDYEDFWRNHDNNRKDEAQEVLDQAHPELAKMIDTVMDLLEETGTANQTVKQQKGRPDPVDIYFYHNGVYRQARAEKHFWRDDLNAFLTGFSEAEQESIIGEAPQYWQALGKGDTKHADEILATTPGLAKFIDKVRGTAGVKQVSGMMVFDSSRGGYRPIRSTPRGKFYPRMIDAKVGMVLKDTSYRMGKGKELWGRMVEALIEGGHITEASEAHRYLSGYFSKEISDDYFAGVEKARQKKLPEMFYDYSASGLSMYAHKWSYRISQVEQFGQDMGKGAPDLFDEVTGGFSDNRTKQYVEQIATQVYQKRQYDTLLGAMDAANILATATQLGNPATATLNLLGGTVLNWQLMGAKNMLRAFKDLVFDWKGIQQKSVELGIGGKDLMNILNDTERQASNLFSEETSIKKALSKFADLTMTWGGYRGTENIIRVWGMVGAQYQLQDAIGAHKSNPGGPLAGKYRALMERNGIDYDKVMSEGGAGEETAKYLRKMVNIPQGSYRIDQTPMYVDTRIGRFLFKYQKFGTQVSRMFWMNYLKPFMDAKTGADRFSAFMGLLGFFAKGIAGGSLILATRAALFGYRDPGPDDDDIKKAFENDDFHRGFGLVASRAFHNLMAASALGFFGNYINFALDVTDQQRPKNPFDPPALGTIKGMQDLIMTYLDQGTLTAGDLDNYLQAQLALYRGYKRAGTSIGSEFNSDWKAAQLFDAGMERSYARKAAMQFARETGVEAKRQQSGMPVKSPMTPINRDLYDALVLGDATTARAIVREALKGKNVKERKEAILSMQASARARQPLSIQGRMTQKDRAGFYRWARENLAEENFNRVRDMDKQYRNTMVRAGLAKKTGWIPPEI